MGPEGPAGKDGIDGNANVKSITESVLSSDWIAEGTEGEDLYFYYEIPVPEITDDIIHSGAVIVYVKENDGSYVILPAAFNFYSNNYKSYYFTTIGFAINTGKLIIDVDYTDLNTYRPDTMEFKIVIIAGFFHGDGDLYVDFTN